VREPETHGPEVASEENLIWDINYNLLLMLILRKM
jgi:hypothetical protein